MNRQTPIPHTETQTTFAIDPQEQVRRRAFEIYETRGKEHGHDLEDWLQAEAEIISRRPKAVAVGA